MSGHSKWSTIKRKKGAQDAKRSNLFAKLLRAVEVAAREGGGSVEGNMTLASAVEKAKDASVPNENIERAIKRGTGELEGGARYEEVTYEGYGPGGVALFVETLTDNRNRTAQDVRHAFSRSGGNLGETGSTAWMFTRKGVIQIEKDAAPDEVRLLEIAMEAGAEDLADAESTWEVTTDPTALIEVRDAIAGAGVPVLSAELSMLPQTQVPVEGGQARQVLALLEALEELDDVQNIYANFDIPEELMAEAG
ncbi:MAG TPA: YebC/PmpR family DNA-binding transcriptional regulator [Actinomycetota bacterium]|jgi:YebC/PmpR family DNA-binding regulatory protein|nr:YebC/PmpR family DNA-binding transcriptional regulator [Actinomycetota bacterium]